METATLIALLIFVPTYILISVRNLKLFVLERYTVALFGAALMVLLGVVSTTQALEAIDLNTIALLLGMMLMVVGLELCGFFNWVSIQIVKRAKNQFQLLVMIMFVTAVLSALILNDTVVLLFTPVVIKTCLAIKVNPVPFLIAEAVSANIGSVATPVGNPQNAFIAIQSGIGFNQFFITLFPVAVISLLSAFIIIWIVFRKDFIDGKGKNGGIGGSKVIGREQAISTMGQVDVHRSIYALLVILACVFLGFIFSRDIGIPISMVALIGGASALFILPMINRRVDARTMVYKVDWTLILFFIGLFVLLKGVAVSGLLDTMIDTFKSISNGGIGSIIGLSTFCAILSNLISNVPAVMLLAPFVSSLGDPSLWLALAASSTLAGNATILGAAANVIVVEKANGEGIEVGLIQFMKAGIPITFITLVISSVLLSII